MDDAGNPTAKVDMLQQMKNCYSDFDKVLKHYGCTFEDVVVENVFTTNMPEFLKHSAFRNTIYTKQLPKGSWLGVKELALPEFLIEIESCQDFYGLYYTIRLSVFCVPHNTAREPIKFALT